MSKANEALDKKAENARELELDYGPSAGTRVSKVWWDGEKLMAKPIPLEDFYKPAQQEPVGCEGAVVNGRVYADRLEHNYKFECEAGPLHLCTDWVEFRRCFEWLAQHTSPPAQQEPAFHGFMDEETCCVNICYTPWAPGGPNNELPTAYYTSPPAQRTWVGLSDEEKRQLFDREDYQGWLDYINAIEAKLRSKNEDRN